VATIYSDDGGRTWKPGDIALRNEPAWPSPTAPSIVQLADGRVMLNVRSRAQANRRIVTVSPDGAAGWRQPHYDPSLLEPLCEAGLVRYSLARAGGGRNRILFSNPDNLSNVGRPEVPGEPRDRKNLSVKLSYDEARTWPVNRVLDPGPNGYSDLGVLPDGTILCFYDHGVVLHHSGQISLRLSRFNLEWLTVGKDMGP
jgi:sialidase-1